MNGKGVTIVGITALLAALAASGEGAANAVMALALVPGKMATALPWGLGSFLLSLALACLVYYHARNRFAYGKGGPSGRDFRVTLLTLIVACAATMAQAATHGGSASELLQALMLGILAGLLAPLLVQGIVSLLRQGNPP